MRGSSLLALLPACAVAQPTAVRGVPKSEWPSYLADGDSFRCRDGGALIPIARLNDDYCDCADGSDEPGTSACDTGRFYCANRGFRAQYVRAAVVNDGVCDCCDGSDEHASGAGCPSNCAEAGAAARAEAEARLVSVQRGRETAAAWEAEGASAKAQWAEEAAALRETLAPKKEAQAQAEEAKRVAEEKEKVLREEFLAKKAEEDKVRQAEEAQRAAEAAAAAAEAGSGAAEEGAVKAPTTRCGADWADANDKCGQSCGADAPPAAPDEAAPPCPDGENCFADLAAAPCMAAAAMPPSGEGGGGEGEGSEAMGSPPAEQGGDAAAAEGASAPAEDAGGADAHDAPAGDDVAGEGEGGEAYGSDAEPPQYDPEAEGLADEPPADHDYGGGDDIEAPLPDDDAYAYAGGETAGHDAEWMPDPGGHVPSEEAEADDDDLSSTDGGGLGGAFRWLMGGVRYWMGFGWLPWGGSRAKGSSGVHGSSSAGVASPPFYDFSDPEAEAARTAFNEAGDAVREVERQIEELEKKSGTDYGPNMVYERLSRQCFKFEPGGEFSYELCPYKSAKQMNSAGITIADLGNWEGFEDGSDYRVMKLGGGAVCWNGPARSLTVSVACAEADKILGVEEPEVCKYTMRFETPAACTEADVAAAQQDVHALSPAPLHDEL